MIQNLPEDFLYNRLPEALIDLDERGLIQAVVGGIQDRLEDLRAYGKNMQQFFAVNNFPQTGNNVILVDLQSEQGKQYTRSLDIQGDTPADGSSALRAWAAAQLGLEVTAVANVRYGVDMLRVVDTNTLDYLAGTIGAVLYQTSIIPASGVQAEQQQIIRTYFPRLKIKGTAESFDVLGRVLGFDDIRMTPLWSRLSVRQPNDIGAPANDPDFATQPEYIPQQHFDDFYNPLKTDDGPFYTWNGTANHGTASTQFYTQSINGFSPFINVIVLGVQNGTVVDPANGTYALGSSGTHSLGGPHKKAYVDPPGSTLRFQALAEGPSFNGMIISVGTDTTGTNTTLTISDRLSAIKYRSSYFDLSITADPNKVEEVFGSSAAQRNKDLANNPTLTADGTAVSPFRPWVSGSLTTGTAVHDFITVTGTNTPSVIVARNEATAVNRQLNVDSLIAAGVQVTQAMEEVRPATRIPRHASTGLLLNDTVPYAAYGTASVIFSTNGTALSYSGSYAATPLPTYVAAIDVVTTNGTSTAVAEITRSNQSVYQYSLPGFSGTYNFANGTYRFAFGSAGTGTNVVARWTPTSTEVIRPEPSFRDKSTGTVAYQSRPEDDKDQELVDEVFDDYPWRRDLVGGGELVELDTYVTSTADVAIDVVNEMTAVQAHTGIDMQGIAIPSPATGHLRLMFQPSPTGKDYRPNKLSVGYTGAFKDLSSLTAQELQLINTENDLETMFQPGYSIYLVGLAQDVLVADMPKFFAPPHRDGMVGWLPFNEHREDDLVVLDHSSVNGVSTLLGVLPENRTWSNERGWFLNLNAHATVLCDGYRSITDEQSISFWINPSANVTSGVTTILSLGPLSFDLNNGANTVSAYVGTHTSSGPVRDLIDTKAVTADQWNFLYIRKSSNTAAFGWGGNLGTIATETIITTTGTFLPATTDDTRMVVTAGTLPYGVHDLRIWDKFKSQSEMNLIRYHSPNTTQTNYRLGFIQTVNKRDRYGFRVLPNGFATTDILPAWFRSVRMGLVRRYDSTGAYTGEDRFKEVGLGGGRPLPATYHLGSQFTALTAAGTTVFATTHGEPQGNNALWLNDSYAGTYSKLSGAVTTSGTAAVHVWSGTSSPFPNPMVETNPNRDEIWVKGVDGYVYEVALYGSLANTTFTSQRVTRNRTDAELKLNKVLQVFNSTGSIFAVTAQGTIFPNQLLVTTTSGSIVSIGTNASTGAVSVTTNGTTQVSVLHPLNLRYAEQPTGAQVILSGTGTLASVSAAGSFFQMPWSGTLTTPPVYMYLNQRIVAAADNAWTQWTDNTNSAAFGNKQTPPVAALNQDGVLELETSGTLLAGLYELDVTSGNIGIPDPDFRGFNVQVSINSVTFQAVLLKNRTGYNVTGTDSFRFTLNDSLIGDWLISFDWTNAYANPATGVARQLAIYSYQLRRLATELYRVEINSSGTTPKLTKMTTS